ncbi:ABC transporter permease [Acidisoma cellulosilytica]|uniref:ABC transporter permease n=1 Tax=Acidisoma cellulosilyticum TaxID=2802395 RepID=A0A963Z2E9_9PROT|nr:ABC transporter permease [Acidisoma cellulosilyticum]MCB8881608.1 ABC transporter permease [Acidisoma cellulosilyticum]
MGILRFIAARAALGVLTLFAVSILLYLGTQLLPGDVASALLGQSATPDALAVLRAKLGLNEPAYLRYLHWLWGVLHGNLGNSLTTGTPIAGELMPRLINTLFLAGYAAIIAVPLAVGLGILSAIREGSLMDRLASILSLAAISFPEFFVSYILIVVFASQLGWLPSLATVYDGMGFWDRVDATTLPAITLTLVVVAHMLRMTRTSTLAVMSAPYVETAFLKGLSRSRVVLSHALPNALAPIINVVAINLAYLVVGVVVVEVVFVYPGVGQLMVDAVTKRDLPTVQACGLVFAIVFIGLNTIADICSALANPRLRSRKRQ